MKFLAKKEVLLKSLRNVINIVSQRTTMPILSNILLEVENNKLYLSATDLDISITTSINVEAIEDGAITIHSKSFFDIIRELPNKPIEISVKENKVKIKTENGKYSMVGLSKDEFPAIPHDQKGDSVALDFSQLKDMIENTTFAVSKNDTRKELNGIYWKVEEDESIMVATDGHKLSKTQIKLTEKIASKKEIIVPPKALDQVCRLLGESEEGQEVVISDNYAIFKFENTSLYTRLIEGPYPNYEQVIPYSNNKELVVNRQMLLSSIKRVGIFSDFQTHQIRLSIKQDKLILSAINRDINGEAQEEIAGSFTGEDMDMGFNGNYLIEILKRFNSDDVLFKLSEPLVAGLLFPGSQKQDEEFFCLIMPLKLD